MNNTLQDLYVATMVPQRKFMALNMYIRKQKRLQIKNQLKALTIKQDVMIDFFHFKFSFQEGWEVGHPCSTHF